MSKIEAIVFDADGTLLDTRELIRLGYVGTMRKFGFANEAEKFEVGTVSRPVLQTYQDLLRNKPAEVLATMVAYHEELQDKSVEAILAYEGLRELLVGLRKRKIAVGLFTSGTTRHIRRNFGQVGFDVDEVFDAYVTADDKVPPKPSHKGLDLCLKKLGVNPKKALYAGDHVADIRAGQAAQVYATVGLLHGLGSRSELEAAGADYLSASLAEILPIIDSIEDQQ